MALFKQIFPLCLSVPPESPRLTDICLAVSSLAPGTRSASRPVFTKSLRSLAVSLCDREIDEFSYSVFIYRPHSQSHLTGWEGEWSKMPERESNSSYTARVDPFPSALSTRPTLLPFPSLSGPNVDGLRLACLSCIFCVYKILCSCFHRLPSGHNFLNAKKRSFFRQGFVIFSPIFTFSTGANKQSRNGKKFCH